MVKSTHIIAFCLMDAIYNWLIIFILTNPFKVSTAIAKMLAISEDFPKFFSNEVAVLS